LSIGVLALAAGLRLWHISQLPTGLYHDEAFFLLRGQDILRGVDFPIYITGDNGNEPLFSYLCAITIAILGPVTWAGRLVTVWIGLIGVAFVIRASESFFPKRGTGVLAGLALATFYWDINFSRFGNLPILMATGSAGALACFWHGACSDDLRAYALAGLCLGLGLISYVPFRLFPFAVLAAGLALFITRNGPNERLSLVTGGLLMAGIAALIYAPLAWFFLHNPQWFFNRFAQTTQGTLSAADRSAVLLTNVLKTLGGLFVSGDENWRHNLAGRPALDAAQAFFFVLGLGASLRQWHKPETWALLAWLLVGLMPAVLTVELPHFGRTTMAIPAIALLMAEGIRVIWDRTSNRLTRGLVVTAIGLSAALTVRDYFGRWAHDPNTVPAFNGQQVWIAQTLRTSPTGSSLYVTPLDFRQDFWTYEYVLGTEAFKQFRTFNGRECLVMPSHTTQATTYAVVVTEDEKTLPELAAAFPAGTSSTPDIPERPGYVRLYHIPPEQQAQLTVNVSRHADFGGFVRMVGYTLAADTFKPGGQLQLQIAWQAEQPTPTAYKIFVHLVGPPKADGNIIYTQSDTHPCADSYPSWQWQLGELIVDTYTLALPADMPPGQYTLQTGWYEDVQGGAGARLPASDDAGQSLGGAVKLETVKIAQP